MGPHRRDQLSLRHRQNLGSAPPYRPAELLHRNSFQNWTRDSSDILGTAFLYVDYSIPVEDLRKQLEAIVHPSPLWDEKVCGLQVTNLTDRSMELRCLVSSRNSSDNFDLRCLVREKMTAWIQQNYPDAFPTTRFASRSDSQTRLETRVFSHIPRPARPETVSLIF